MVYDDTKGSLNLKLKRSFHLINIFIGGQSWNDFVHSVMAKPYIPQKISMNLFKHYRESTIINLMFGSSHSVSIAFIVHISNCRTKPAGLDF